MGVRCGWVLGVGGGLGVSLTKTLEKERERKNSVCEKLLSCFEMSPRFYIVFIFSQ